MCVCVCDFYLNLHSQSFSSHFTTLSSVASGSDSKLGKCHELANSLGVSMAAESGAPRPSSVCQYSTFQNPCKANFLQPALSMGGNHATEVTLASEDITHCRPSSCRQLANVKTQGGKRQPSVCVCGWMGMCEKVCERECECEKVCE